MQNFRQFEAGPDPFGRKFQILFKWMQTAISLRHADTVDVKFILVDENGGRTEKTIALPHADLLRVAGEVGRKVDDPWCSRLGAMHLRRLVETGEDMEKDLVTVSAADLKGLRGEAWRYGEIGGARVTKVVSHQYWYSDQRFFLSRFRKYCNLHSFDSGFPGSARTQDQDTLKWRPPHPRHFEISTRGAFPTHQFRSTSILSGK